MGIGLAAGLVERAQGRAGKLDLAARLERDVLAVLLQADDMFALEDGIPVETLQLGEDRADAARLLVGQRPEALLVVGELLVFGADQPLVLGLAARFQALDELGLVGDGSRVEFGIADGRKGAQALSVRVLEVPTLTSPNRKPAEDLAIITEDLIGLLDQVGGNLKRGKYPEAAHGKKVAQLLRRVAEELEG